MIRRCSRRIACELASCRHRLIVIARLCVADDDGGGGGDPCVLRCESGCYYYDVPHSHSRRAFVGCALSHTYKNRVSWAVGLPVWFLSLLSYTQKQSSSSTTVVVDRLQQEGRKNNFQTILLQNFWKFRIFEITKPKINPTHQECVVRTAVPDAVPVCGLVHDFTWRLGSYLQSTNLVKSTVLYWDCCHCYCTVRVCPFARAAEPWRAGE